MKRVESNEAHITVHPALHYKYIMMVFVMLMVCTLLVAVFALANDYKHMNEMAELRAQNQQNSHLATQMLRETRAVHANSKCKPLSQDELPAANLFGKEPTTIDRSHLEDIDDGQETGTYKWLTPDHSYGLLAGGMTFNKQTGHLHIPKNGTYYMFSTIRFWRQHNLNDDIDRLTVNIKITSRCNTAHLGNLYENTYFNPKHYVIIPKGQKGASYTTQTSGIARLCKNDYIYLNIQGMPSSIVIKSGGSASTNFGAFMIAPSCQDDEISVLVTNGTESSSTTPTNSPASTTQPPSSPTPNNRCARRHCK